MANIKNKLRANFIQISVLVLTVIQMFILASLIACAILGFVLLVVSIFSTVPPILSTYYWAMFLIVTIPITVILVIIVLIKAHKETKKKQETEIKNSVKI